MPTETLVNIMDEEEAATSSLLPPLAGDGTLHLLKPTNKKSKFWVHFSEYDPDAHPDKKQYARCNICGREISVKQGTGGLKNHMKFKHPEENAALMEYSEFEGATEAVGGNSSDLTPATPAASPPKKKARSSLFQDISSRMDIEQRMNQKNDLELWSLIRREIKALKTELEVEEDVEAVKELERDLRGLRNMKANIDAYLGFLAETETIV